MAGRVPEHVIQRIVRSVDVVRLAGQFCDLKKRGKKYWALCPFHKEKTPSFTVDPDNGLYYCFGCKEGGNIFTLLQKLDGLSFAEALERCAREAGVDLSQYRGRSGPSRSETSKLREVNELATAFYQKCLQKARGSETARSYLAERSFSEESIQKWRLGYAPEGWENFLKVGRKRDYEPELLARAGLIRPREGASGHYDRFRNRLMFPIADARGRTIGFGARALTAEDEPKYLNSPETPLFRKGQCFFGLAQAKAAVRSAGTAVLLEGYTDVIMAHQHGVEETIAVLGTALTDEHARRLSRLCERVILVFDPDQAGQKSAERSIQVLLPEDVEIRVASLPEGQDPCEFILAEGAEAFRERLKASEGFFEFSLRRAAEAHDVETVQGRVGALRELTEIAEVLRGRPAYDPFLRRTAEVLGIRQSAVREQFERGAGRPARPEAPPEESATLSAAHTVPPELLGLLLCNPELLPEAAERVEEQLLRDCPERRLLANLLGECRAGRTVEPEGFVAAIEDPELAGAATRAVAQEQARRKHIAERRAEDRLGEYLQYLERRKLRRAQERMPDSDDELRDYVRKLKEQDQKSVR